MELPREALADPHILPARSSSLLRRSGSAMLTFRGSSFRSCRAVVICLLLTSAAFGLVPVARAAGTHTITINPGSYTGRYFVDGFAIQYSGLQTLDLAE